MLTGTPLPATTKDKNINVGGDLLQHLEDFTQKEPKQSLSKNALNERITAQRYRQECDYLAV